MLENPIDPQSSQEMTNRSLNGVTQAILRALTHLALLVGLTTGRQVISKLMQKGQHGDEIQLGELLWQHLRADLRSLHRSLGRNIDECFLTVHLLLRDLYLQSGKRISIKHERGLGYHWGKCPSFKLVR